MNKNNKSMIKIYDTNSNQVNTALLAKELIQYYRTFEDKVPQLTLREIDQITKLLESYVSKITLECIFVDCNHEDNINNLWEHLFTCTKSPKAPYVETIVKVDDVKYKELKKKYFDLKKMRPFQVDYFSSLSESYLKENRYIDSVAPKNLKEFIEFKNEGWEVIEDTSSWRAYKKIVEETDLPALKTSVVISANIRNVFYLVDDPENYCKLFKFTDSGYTIRQINATTRLYYLGVKPGFGETYFIVVQTIYIKGNTITLLRTSLDEEESPHKYTYPEKDFITLRKGFIYFEAFILTSLDNRTCEVEYYNNINYNLEDVFEEVTNKLFEYNFTILKTVKSICEEESLKERQEEVDKIK